MADQTPRITRKPQPQPTITDQVVDAGKMVGSAALSGLGMVGNLLDLIPSMARDVAVLDNPFDQFLDPLSHSSTGRSASGRDVLSRNILTSWLFTPNKENPGMSGWASDPAEAAQDILGFGLEMASGGFIRAPGAIVRGVRGVPTAAAPAMKAAAGASAAASPAVAAAKASSPFSKITRGLRKVGQTLDKLDPGNYVGRGIERMADNTRRALVFGPERKRVAELLKGVANSGDEADAVLRVAEARAMTWAKEQPGRTPDEYFKGFEDIRKSELSDVGADALQQNPADPSTYRSEPFYSKIMEAVDAGKIPNKVGREQLLKTLTGYGVKQEEIADMAKDFDEMFSAAPDGKVSKDDLFALAADKAWAQNTVTEVTQWRAPIQMQIDSFDEELRRLDRLVGQARSAGDESLIKTILAKADELEMQKDSLYRQMDAMEGTPEAKYADFQVPGGNPGTYRELLLRNPMHEFHGSHFSEDFLDVQAHARVDEVTLPSGEKAMRIQEIQSDLHQKGAKEGYSDVSSIKQKIAELEKERRRAIDELHSNHKVGSPGFTNSPEYRYVSEVGQKLLDLNGELRSANPDAPFKKSWPDLMAKIILRDAAEKGYDIITLVPGEAAAKAVGGPEGALGKFYNDKITNIISKMVKKGGGTVERVVEAPVEFRKIPSRRAGNYSLKTEVVPDFTGQIEKTSQFVENAEGTGRELSDSWFARAYSPALKMNAAGTFRSEEEALNWIKKHVSDTTVNKGRTIFRITPEMKADLLQKGQPLYQKPSASAGPKGAIEFLDDNRAVIHAFQSADVSTLAHELGHKFRRDIPDSLLQEAASALNVTDPQSWSREAEEAFASGFERYLRDGSAPTAGLVKVFEKFKEWLTSIYQSIAGTPLEESVNPQLRAVFDQMLGGQKAVSPTGNPLADMMAAVDVQQAQAQPGQSAAANQIDDPILRMAGNAAPLSPSSTIRGKLDRVGDFLNELDPGTHVGRILEKGIKQASEKFSLPEIYNQQVTERFLKTRFGKAWAQRSAQKSARVLSKGPKDSSGGQYFADMTAQQELQYLIGSGTVARGSRILTDLTPDQDLATRIGSAFGGQVLFWGGSNKSSRAGGVRVHDTGSRVWVSADASASTYNNIVGHELMHLLRDADAKAFSELVKVIQTHAPSEELAKQTAQYMDDYRKVFGRELHAGVRQEEGVARTVQAAFDRPAFWEDLLINPSVAAPVRQAFQQTMDKLKVSGKLTAQEFEVVDREMSAFIFGQADTMRAGATPESLAMAAADRYSSTQVDPLANLLAEPGTKINSAIRTVEDLATRINAGIQAAMNYKVGGHTYPVVQAFSRDKTNLYEAMVSDVSLPAMSAVETVHKLVDALPEADAITALSKHEEDIVRAIEKGDYANLHPELHPAVRQMELAQKALFERELRAGVKVEQLSDTYVQYFNHALHPAIREKLAEIDAASSLRSPADLAATHKATQSRRTELFREAWQGRATWNVATSDPKVLETLKNTAVHTSSEARSAAAADVLRTRYLTDIDPRIPVVRDGEFVMLQRDSETGQISGQITVSADHLRRMQRVPSQHDLTTEAGRIAEHTNEPIIYTLDSADADGNKITTEFEMLTARLPGDTRYGDATATLPDGSPDRVARGYYQTPAEGDDRFRALSDWMVKVGTDTLEKTSGVFSGSALRNWQESMRSKTNTLAVAETMPQLMAGAIRDGKLMSAQGDPVKVGRSLTLKSLFDSPYFNILDRKKVYLKAATLDPGLQQIARTSDARKFVQIMDDMVLDKDIMDDLKLAGTYTQRLPAIENLLKPAQSAGSLWKAGVLTHPGRYVRDMLSGLAQLVYGNRFSNSAADAARRVTFNEPVEELLHYDAVKNYLDRFEMEHTPENATRAVRAMFGNFMQQSGGSIYRDYTDVTKPLESAARGIESMAESFPGDGRTGVMDMLKGVGRTAIGREGDTTFNPFDIAGVQHAFNKKDAAGNIIAQAGDVRTDSRFAPVVAGDIIGKHANDSVRLAGFLEGLRRGEAPLDAWKAVTANQLDYNPRTFGPLESKVLKKIFPFYSFVSRETAWLANELMTNPTGRLGKLIQLARHSQSTDEFLPEHITQGLAIPLRESEDGTENYVTGLGAMFESPIQLLGEAGSGDLSGLSRMLLSMSSPIIKGPAEYGLGRSSFQGGPLGGRDLADMDPVGGRILTQLGIQKERPGGQAAPAFGSPGLEFLLSNSPVSRILSSAKTALDDRKNVIERAANVLTGMRITSVSPEQKQRGIREMTNAISKELGARPFTTFHISDELLADAKENDPEKYATLLRIKEMRKEWDKQQRIKRKEKAP